MLWVVGEVGVVVWSEGWFRLVRVLMLVCCQRLSVGFVELVGWCCRAVIAVVLSMSCRVPRLFVYGDCLC